MNRAAFSDINSEYSNDINEDIFDNRIIILKRVKSLKQLRRTEKELVRLNYKETVIKGFTMKGIQQYIASKTKIWIEWPCLECLKKAEEQENREWYCHMAKDHFAYIGAYRKCIDELDLLKKEVWSILMDPNTTKETKILASKELHSLSKTYTLLIKDLPFVTNLSKYYDKDMLNSSYVYPLHSKGTNSKKDWKGKGVIIFLRYRTVQIIIIIQLACQMFKGETTTTVLQRYTASVWPYF